MTTTYVSAMPASIDLNILTSSSYKELCPHPILVLKTMDL